MWHTLALAHIITTALPPIHLPHLALLAYRHRHTLGHTFGPAYFHYRHTTPPTHHHPQCVCSGVCVGVQVCVWCVVVVCVVCGVCVGKHVCEMSVSLSSFTILRDGGAAEAWFLVLSPPTPLYSLLPWPSRGMEWLTSAQLIEVEASLQDCFSCQEATASMPHFQSQEGKCFSRLLSSLCSFFL